MIKERPILFSTPMVQALLAGKKTQTRRKVKDQEYSHAFLAVSDTSPYGKIGDRLWVRETTQEESVGSVSFAVYSADASFVRSEHGIRVAWWGSSRKCPAIYMPRRFSRILLEITGIRVEPLHEISETDAIAEGIRGFIHSDGGNRWEDCSGISGCLSDPRDSYKTLWEKINGAGSWSSNPWVWAIEFKRVSDAT